MGDSIHVKEKFTGVIVPMISPFTSTGDIDVEAVQRVVENIVSNQCSVFVLGTTGEALSISTAKKKVLVEATVSAVAGRKPVYAGISGNCYEETVENAKLYKSLGADAVVAHLPSYYPMNEKHIENYFTNLADDVPLPLILYNMPATTHHTIPVAMIDRLSRHQNIVGIKDSERGEVRLDRSLELWKDREDFVFHLGWAAKSAYGVLHGLDGIVPSSGNLVPALYQKLFAAAKEGNTTKAEELQELTNEISAYYQAGNNLSESLPRLKAMMQAFGLCRAHAASPMITVSKEIQEQIKQDVLSKFGKYNTHQNT